MTNGVFKSSAKASVSSNDFGGLKANASSDDLVRRIEVKILPDDFNASAESPKKVAKSSVKKIPKQTSSSLKTEKSISSAAKSARNYPTQPKRTAKSYSTQSMSSKSYSYSPVVPRTSTHGADRDMQQYNRLNFKKEHLGIHRPTTHRYNSKYMKNKYNQDNQEWETQSAITPILEDPKMPFGPDLYKNMRDNLKPFCPKLKFVKKEVKPSSVNLNRTARASPSSSSSSLKSSAAGSNLRTMPTRRKQSSQSSMLSEVVFEEDREDDEMKSSVTINVLDGKTVRIKNSDNQYLTGYQHSDHINPKYRFTDRLNEDSDQLFHIEHVNGNSCVLVSVLKHIGYIKPALFYSALTKDLQLRDYYPYCPKERKYFTGNKGQGQNFLFDCNNYHIELPGIGIADLEITQDC